MLEDLEMLKELEGITTHQTAVALPVLPTGQNLDRLRTAAQPLLRDAPHGLLIAGHGLYAWGRDLATFHRRLEILEFLLEQRWRLLQLKPEDLKPQRVSGVSHVLLDIEGTTCPVNFVSDVLFAYAAAKLRTFVEQESKHSAVQCLLEELSRVWRSDQAAAAAGILSLQPKGDGTGRDCNWRCIHQGRCKRSSCSMDTATLAISEHCPQAGLIRESAANRTQTATLELQVHSRFHRSACCSSAILCKICKLPAMWG
ncbi:MAG: class II aldolase/adducin family protein [Cyanobacteriota bacterium]|nr:class II aldolase/adducin family protein [Cyanobacteriota bacterium]